MAAVQTEQQLTHRYFLTLAEATSPLLAAADDQEVALHALIEAADLLRERFEQELAELRQEAD